MVKTQVFRSGETIRREQDDREGVAVRPGVNGTIIVRWKDDGKTECVAASAIRAVGKHDI